MNWITEETTATEVINHTGGSTFNTIRAVEVWNKIQLKKLRHLTIELILEELANEPIHQNWDDLIKTIQNYDTNN